MCSMYHIICNCICFSWPCLCTDIVIFVTCPWSFAHGRINLSFVIIIIIIITASTAWRNTDRNSERFINLELSRSRVVTRHPRRQQVEEHTQEAQVLTSHVRHLEYRTHPTTNHKQLYNTLYYHRAATNSWVKICEKASKVTVLLIRLLYFV